MCKTETSFGMNVDNRKSSKLRRIILTEGLKVARFGLNFLHNNDHEEKVRKTHFNVKRHHNRLQNT